MRTGMAPQAGPARKGRGAISNPQGRFGLRREAFDDGWTDPAEAPEPGAGVPATEVFEEQARSLITRNDSPDVPFDQSINVYRGCEHGCIYCYARPNHGFVGMSSGLDFESKIFVKVNAVERLRAELSAPGYRCRPIALGTATDVYQPLERRYRITRALLECMAKHRQPFSILTKSALIERDIDLIAPMAQQGLASVSFTVTTLDAELARRWEPRASAPWRRLQAMRRLHEAGIPVGVSIAPVVPFLNEPEIERILACARQAGAASAFHSILRLPYELRALFVEWLAEHYPERARRILHRVDDLRAGRRTPVAALSERVSSRFSGEGPWAELLRLRFDMALRKLGYGQRPALRTDLFVRLAGDEPPGAQLGLF